MKKLLALVLSLLMIAAVFASCGDDDGGETASTPKESIPSAPDSTPEETPTESIPAESTDESAPAEEVVFEDCDETVYVVGTEYGLKLRTTTSFVGDANVAVIVDPGTELRRIGIHETWSKVVYQNKEYFASSSFLSTTKPSEETEPDGKIVFEDVDETVYVKTGYEGGQANIYSKPYKSEDYKITNIALPTEGTQLQRTGIAYDDVDPNEEGLGWSRVMYNGVECYIRNSLLSTEAPKTNEQ